jgi:hypothetical protein
MGIHSFLESYNKLDQFMRLKLGADMSVSHAKLLTKMSRLDAVFSRLETKLQAYRALRNAIVHIHHEGETPIAVPNQEVVMDYERLVEYALKPPSALHSIAATNIISVDWQTQIEFLNQLMVEKGLSLIPIIKDQRVEGIYSAWHLQTFLFKKNVVFNRSMEISELYDELNTNHSLDYVHKNFRVGFCHKDATVEDVVNLFLGSAKAKNYFKAVYLTENGHKDDKLLGVITPHCLPTINPNILDQKLNLQ